ncbi:hypothetical protein NIES2134_101800 [Thermostichus vulcanus NIES-2134]|nr:hypothetical protein NIES2134_101800 [Thermostichus vulcanus NIES-2134]
MSIRSYTRSTDCNRVSHGQNIPSGIYIPIMVRPTLRTVPFSDAQWQPLNNVTTLSTAFRTGKPLVNLHQCPTIPLGFVFQLPYQFAPSSITDGSSKLTVLDHVFHSQRLDYDRLVFTYQSSRQLVQMVFSGIRDFLVNLGNFQPRLIPIARAFLFATQRPLRLTESFVVAVKVLGVGNLFPSTQGNEAAHPYVQTNRRVDGLQCQLSGVIKPQTDVPLSSRVKPDGHCGWFNTIWKPSRPANIQRFVALCQEYFSVFPPKSRLAEFCATAIAFLFEVGIFRPTCKKVTESRLQMSQCLLQGDRANLIQKLKVILLLPLSKQGRGLNVVKSLFSFIPGFCSRCQCSVINQPNTAQCSPKQGFLLSCWVEAVTESLLHALNYSDYSVSNTTILGSHRLPLLSLPSLKEGVSRR